MQACLSATSQQWPICAKCSRQQNRLPLFGAQEHDLERVRMELHNLREENTIEARYKEKHFEEKSQNTVAEKEVF